MTEPLAADISDALRLLQLDGDAASNSPDAATNTERLELLERIASAADTPAVQQLALHDDFARLLGATGTPLIVKTGIAKCTAEITKADGQRRAFTEPTVMGVLVDALRVPSERPGDVCDASMEYVIQACRALGNIFYQNDEAREILVRLDGDATLLRLLDVTAAAVPACSAADFMQFTAVRCGLIANYLVGGELVAKRAIDLGIMAKIERLVVEATGDAAAVERNEDLVLNVLPPLTILTENVPDMVFEPELNRRLVRILGASTNADIAEMCLDLLHYQAENDDVKFLLAQEGLCETIYKLLEKYKTQATTSEARALMKLACEIVVLILTGDDSMHYLYTTPLIKYIEDWLDSDDLDLLTTGVLALGNFARTDSHCISMVDTRVAHKLLAILARNNATSDDMRLQHALLSTLRNLVIPKPNKAAVVEAGLVQTILPMLQIHQPPVVFKLLGTLRMTVDGQEKLALELLQNGPLIAQLVHWSRASEFASVTGESLRLMAWLIKHAYFRSRHTDVPAAATAAAAVAAAAPAATSPAVDDSSLRAFVRTDGAVECMVGMLTSQHLVMQNEALIALSILSSVIGSTQSNASADGAPLSLDAVLEQSELGARLAEFITKSADTMTKEIVENLQTFVGLLRRSETLVVHLAGHNIDELLKTIPILTEYCTL